MCDGAFCYKLRSKDGEESVDAPRKALHRGLAMREGFVPGSWLRTGEGVSRRDGWLGYGLHRGRGTAYRTRRALISCRAWRSAWSCTSTRNCLADLNEVLLDTLQLVLNEGRVRSILDQSTATDLETWQDVLYLLQNDGTRRPLRA